MTSHIADLIGPYVLEELDAASVAFVEGHLGECFVCRTEVNEARAVLDVLPLAIDPIVPPSHVRRAIMATIAGPSARRERPRDRLAWALAAGLALALLGDVALGIRLAGSARGVPQPHAVAIATPTPSPLRTVAPVIARPSATRMTPAKPIATTLPSRAETVPTPTATPVLHAAPAAPSPRDLALARSREREIDDLRAFVTRDAGRIAQLTNRLSRDARATASATRDADIVAALASGRVYAVDGVVGTEAWHGTVVQPTATANAILLTRAPSAPSGDDYHVWVLRGGKTFDVGSVVPHANTTLEMPMPLVAGDVVAFSREAVPSSGVPTQPYLMRIAITE